MEKIKITTRLSATREMHDDITIIKVRWRRHEIIRVVGNSVVINLADPRNSSSPTGMARSVNKAAEFLDLGFFVSCRGTKRTWFVMGADSEAIEFSPYKPFGFDLID